MKQIIKNAVVAIVGTNFEGKKSRIHLLHVGNDGKMRGAFYLGGRGQRLHSYEHTFRNMTHFRNSLDYSQTWSPEYHFEGLIVESFVADPTKLTARDYKRMARKAHKLMKRTPEDHVWHIFANQL
ncbi:hypothetical protein CPT_Shelby_010 [Klebsiella phage Shelby]|uniref:Uncharacterized protein n=1 Tax=Klebsiella phage Shelby TaxID=2580405 RepID=A0A5B9N0D7_9CAUD|nr:hypothetical protein H1O12_gp10 [Klebsiella phage Shelby]QEG07271.1 hypothetical protein CPT_Shelby_010 [Klebsiella phage Shelby]